MSGLRIRSFLWRWRRFPKKTHDSSYFPKMIPNDWRMNCRRTITPTSDSLGGTTTDPPDGGTLWSTQLKRPTPTTATGQVTRLQLSARSSRPAGRPNFLNADWSTVPSGSSWLVETVIGRGVIGNVCANDGKCRNNPLLWQLTIYRLNLIYHMTQRKQISEDQKIA